MMYMNDMKLSLTDSDTLIAFKTDFDAVLKATIRKMIENNETEGTLTAKVNILLTTETDDRGVEYVRPTLVHKVSSVVQAKSSQGGLLNGQYALEWDRIAGCYVMRPVKDAQTSMFEN